MKLAALIIVAGFSVMSLLAKDTKEQAFWSWFEKNQEELFHFEKNQDVVFDRLTKALKKVNQDLTFEFGPVDHDKREFVISAGGIQTAFPSVEALWASAPKLPKWTFLKFRQRRSPINDLEYGGHKVKAKDVHYVLFKDEDPKKVGIMVFLDGYTEEKKDSVWGQVGYLFLDEALGEYDVETHVGAIVFSNRQSEHFKKARPISELPAHFDEALGRPKISEPGGAANRSQPVSPEINRASGAAGSGR
jgi:hypothetical protein